MERYALACYLAELTAEMTDADEECPAATRLLLYALRALSDAARDPVIIKAAFELRLMAETGFAPDLSCCASCGGSLGEEVWFSPREGTARCAACIERLGYLGHKRLQAGTAHALSHILTAEIPRVNAFALGEPARTQLGQICEEYTLARAERNFDSLNFYRSLQLLPTASEFNT
jgi:DNA repair protein RecO (recombination protein O)